MPRKKNTLLLKFFSTNERNELYCNNDTCENRLLNAHSGNLERHLKLKHMDIYEKYMLKKQLKNNTIQLIENGVTSSVNKKNIELAIVELFTKNGRPLQMAEDKSFQLLVKPVFESVGIKVNENSINGRILAFAQQVKMGIVNDLKGKLLSLKIDAATKDDLTVLGINVQYIKDGQIGIKTLALKEINSTHTSDYLESIILKVLAEYSIDISHILTVTTDHGAIMLKSAKCLNPDFQSKMEEFNIENNDEEIYSESNVTEETMKTIRSNFALHGITGIRSGADTLQLCVEEVINTPEVKATLERCRSVVKNLRAQKYINISKYGQYHTPTLDCVARWDSTFIMIERLVEMRNIIQSLSSENPCLYLSSDDWKFTEQFMETFKAAYDATLKLQITQLCFSEMYIIIMDIIFKLDSLPTNPMSIALKFSLNRRLIKLFDIELFNASVFLDPRIKICMSAEQKVRAKKYITTLYKRMNSLKDSKAPEKPIMEDILQGPLANNISASSFYEFLENLDPLETAEPISSSLPDIETDFMAYDRQPRLPPQSNVVQFWLTQNNILSGVANIILAIPCTQLSVERLFSAMKYILSDERNRSVGFNVEHILLVKLNDYLSHKECLSYIQEDWMRCTKTFQSILSEGLHSRKNITEKFLEFCCARYAYETCIYNSARYKCYQNSAAFARSTAQMLSDEKQFSNCRQFEASTCSSTPVLSQVQRCHWTFWLGIALLFMMKSYCLMS